MFYLLLVIVCLILQQPLATILVAILWWVLHKKTEEAEEKKYAEQKAKRDAIMAAAKAERAAQIKSKATSSNVAVNSNLASPAVHSTPKSKFNITDGVLDTYNSKDEIAIVPDYVKTIGACAFKNASTLKQIVLPMGIENIGDEAFVDCKNLLHIDVPNSVGTIGEGVFLRCNQIETVKLSNNICLIEKNTFLACRNLTNIILPPNLISIGDQAFYDCNSLRCITIPESVQSIGKAAFSGCKKLESIVIPNGVKDLANRIFLDCYSLESVTLPNELKTIGDESFYQCDSLRSIRLPKSVTTIGVRAFAQCEKLRSIDIPDGTTAIEAFAFAGCSNLTSISIPDSTTFIGDGAFNGCNELLTIRATAGSAAEQYARKNNIRFSASVIQDKNVPVVHEIAFADFVVRSNAFSCYFKHDVETVQAFVSVLSRDGSIRKIKTIAAYCKDCNCYYILDSSFKALQKQGVLLCQLITLAELKGKGFSVFSGEGMKAQSMLRRCGYTVNATDDLSATQRQKILALVLDNRIYSASELYNFLDWLIGYHGRSKQRDMSAAIEKWTDDRNFVANYKAELRRSIGINSISYRE